MHLLSIILRSLGRILAFFQDTISNATVSKIVRYTWIINIYRTAVVFENHTKQYIFMLIRDSQFETEGYIFMLVSILWIVLACATYSVCRYMEMESHPYM